MRISIARTSAFSVALLLSTLLPPARALSNPEGRNLDAAGMTLLEERADHANPREQCFLYTELVHAYTEVAGQQMASGDMDQASVTLRRIQHFAERIHIGLARDTKRLKNTEILMHTASHHLGQYLRLVSSDDKLIVQSTLKQLDKVNDELLAQVFAH